MRILATVLALALCAPFAAAQPRANGPGQGQAAQNRRERVKQRILALRAYTLTDELALDESTAGRLFPALAKYDEEFGRLLQARNDLQNRLKAAPGLHDPNAVNKLIDEAVANQRAFWDVEDKRLAELRKILSPVQTARLLVVLPALERKIQNQLQKAIGNGNKTGPKNRGAAKAGAADDDDDDDMNEQLPPRKPAGGPPGMTKPCDPYGDQHGCR